MARFSGKSIIITGAGAGIGQQLTIGFVREGARVLAISRGQTGLDQTRAQATGPGTLTTAAADVADGEHMEALFAAAAREAGGIDLVVNNAAVYPKQPLAQFDSQSWRAGTSTNLDGVAMCCRAAIRVLPADRPTVILNVGSFAHLGAEPGGTLYCATKAGVHAFTRALATELEATGSRLIVNEWIPGIYQTRMSGHIGEDPALAFERLVSAWQASLQGPGGRLFEGAHEVLPPRSLRSKLLGLLRPGRR